MVAHRGLTFAAIALLAASGPACSRASAATGQITIGIHHSRFSAASIEVKAGSTVTFVINNDDPIDHEFILGDNEVQQRHESGTETKHGSVPGEVSVPAKAKATTSFTFSKPGTLTFACHLPGHFAYGMKGSVGVV